MRIRFRINYHTRWGQQLYVLGSHHMIGSWDPAKAFRMDYCSDGEWLSEIEFPYDDLYFEYKYIVKDDSGNIVWEFGPNRKPLGNIPFLDSGKSQTVELRDAWHSGYSPESVFNSSIFSEVVFSRDGVSEGKLAAEKGKQSGPETLIRLCVSAPRVSRGESVFIVGSISVLGNWDVNKALPMEFQQFPFWCTDIVAGSDICDFEYKYIIKDESGKVILYEGGDNRLFEKCGKPVSAVVSSEDKFRYSTDWKGAGVAIPVFSIRTKQSLGIGEFADIKNLADWVSRVGFKIIQILPVNDTSAHMNWLDSYPYTSISVFALHPIYINLETIAKLPEEIATEIQEQRKVLNSYDYVHYEDVIKLKMRILREIFKLEKDRCLSSLEFKKFCDENSSWLKPYAAFCVLRDKYGTVDFRRWGEYSVVSEDILNKLTSSGSEYYDEINFYCFIQLYLHKQLSEASEYAKKKGVAIKGDVPIGIHKFSDSCWANRELFNMDQSAGAPPDPFSDDGQNWRFPTYNWDAMKRDGYLWWRWRMKHMSRYFQMIRLDHVLGFFRIWEIPDYSVSGLMGHFNPVIPISREELEGQGVWDFNRLCDPYIPAELLSELFGKDTSDVKSEYLEKSAPGFYRLKPEFSTQRQIDLYLTKKTGDGLLAQDKATCIRKGLFALISNFLFFAEKSGAGFHPRINMTKTYSFLHLDRSLQWKMEYLYNYYYYHKQENFWRMQGLQKLPVLKSASNMLICGEDLGMIPDCVPKVMEELCLLGLRIERMPKETDREFSWVEHYPYLTVCSTSSHDMSTVRGWWEEDRVRAQRYYNNVLKHSGEAPTACGADLCGEIVTRHLESPSMWAVFPIQDILGMSDSLKRKGDPKEEQINNPANPKNYWKYRLHINIEELIEAEEFNEKLLRIVKESGR